MSKAILVLDMPEKCIDCPILEYCHNNDGKCDLNIRQSWCPLKEPPEREESSYSFDEFEDGHVYGWNACIDEILGE
jgi:hypothetical protein